MKASQIVSKMTDGELSLVLKDIAAEHAMRSGGKTANIDHLVALEKNFKEDGTLSDGMVMLVAKEAALVEGCSRWLEVLNETG